MHRVTSSAVQSSHGALNLMIFLSGKLSELRHHPTGGLGPAVRELVAPGKTPTLNYQYPFSSPPGSAVGSSQ